MIYDQIFCFAEIRHQAQLSCNKKETSQEQDCLSLTLVWNILLLLPFKSLCKYRVLQKYIWIVMYFIKFFRDRPKQNITYLWRENVEILFSTLISAGVLGSSNICTFSLSRGEIQRGADKYSTLCTCRFKINYKHFALIIVIKHCRWVHFIIQVCKTSFSWENPTDCIKSQNKIGWNRVL